MSAKLGNLTLNLPGLTAAQGREVADRLGERLVERLQGRAGSMDSLRVSIETQSSDTPGTLAERIAAAVARSIDGEI